jgi:hypothetical protein
MLIQYLYPEQYSTLSGHQYSHQHAQHCSEDCFYLSMFTFLFLRTLIVFPTHSMFSSIHLYIIQMFAVFVLFLCFFLRSILKLSSRSIYAFISSRTLLTALEVLICHTRDLHSTPPFEVSQATHSLSHQFIGAESEKTGKMT